MIDKTNVKPEHLWYVIGLIATDGNLSKDGRHINITSKDREHLFLIKTILHLTGTIGSKARSNEKEKRYSTLQFSDVHFYRYLTKIGIFPAKSLTLGKINVNHKYFRDFLRGVIDGDGCIRQWIHKSNFHHQWSIHITSASRSFLEWLEKETWSEFEIRGRLYTYHKKSAKNPISILKFGKLASKIIIREIYYESCVALKRKESLARLCLQDPNRMLNYGGVLGPGAVTGSQN